MMNKNYTGRLLLLSIFWGSCFITAAQESRTLTLQESIDLSIKYSKRLRAGNSKVAEAVAATREAMEKRLPDVNVNGSYLCVNKRCRCCAVTGPVERGLCKSRPGTGLPYLVAKSWFVEPVMASQF